MSPAPELSAPGSSSYSSNTMHVGDGTWDSSRDTFLLPNLVGLNFATMRYNGMGNRFLEMPAYHRLILGHGILAAITFLGLVPISILINRYYTGSQFWALRWHIWLQILTLFTSTVIIILGFFAVGPARSLTNPHHGIGVAVYCLVVFQALSGCLTRNRDRGTRRRRTPLQVMVHRWVGNATALLGIVQVPLGLTLYGSPESLFILFAIWGFAMLVLYFVLSWLNDGYDFDDRGTYTTGTEVVEERKHSGLGRLAMAGAAGAGLAALWRRNSHKRARSDVPPDSEDSYLGEEEKYSEASRHGIGHRLLQVGAIGGGIAALRSLFKRKDQDDDYSSVSYRPPLGGNQAATEASYSAVEDARPITPGRHPLANPPLTPSRVHSRSSMSWVDSFESASPSRRGQHTFRNTLATLGAAAALRQLFKGRRQRKEDRRAEEIRQHEMEQERIQRTNSEGRFTGDGSPRRHRRYGSQTASTFSSFDGRSNLPSGALPAAGAAAAAALHERNRIRPVGADPVVAGSSGIPVTDIPPPPGVSHVDSSGSENLTATSRPSHHLRDEAAAGLAGAALGAAAAKASDRRHSRHTADGESPSASLRMKVRNDSQGNQHITLRQLTEEERRRNARSKRERRRKNGSLSSASGTETASGDRRWRRTEELERRQAEEMRAQQEPYAAGALPATVAGPSTTIPQGYTLPPPPPGPPPASQPANYPPPPPIPESNPAYTYGASSVTSPGTESGYASTEYAANRRRRRAERAQAKLAREGRTGGGPSVEFA